MRFEKEELLNDLIDWENKIKNCIKKSDKEIKSIQKQIDELNTINQDEKKRYNELVDKVNGYGLEIEKLERLLYKIQEIQTILK